MTTPLKKLMIRTWRGPLPPWTPQFRQTVSRLSETGWDFAIIDDWESVRLRANKRLGVAIPDQIDTRKPGDYDPAIGELFPDLIKGYDFWGHFNLDCVYGRLSHFLPDDFLTNIDIYGNDPGAVCGPFTIYQNCEKVNRLYREAPTWKEDFENPHFLGWDEGVFSDYTEREALRGGIRFTSGFLQAHDHMTESHRLVAWGIKGRHDKVESLAGPTKDTSIVPTVWFDDKGTLIDGVTGQEIMMYHFNQTRRWPVG